MNPVPTNMLSSRFPALLFFAFVLISARNASPSAAQDVAIETLDFGDDTTPSLFRVRVFGRHSRDPAYMKAISRALDRVARLWKSKIRVDVRIELKF